jgi:hypothetical protein
MTAGQTRQVRQPQLWWTTCCVGAVALLLPCCGGGETPPSTELAQIAAATSARLLSTWNLSAPGACVALAMFDGVAPPTNASALAGIVGQLSAPWGVEAADVVGDVCFQGAVRDFGQGPVAVGGDRGRCRVRCQQAIDSCGTSFPRVVVEGGASRLSYRRGQDVRIGATIQWNNTLRPG